MPEPLTILSLRRLPGGGVRIFTAMDMPKEEKIKLLQEALEYLSPKA